MGFSRPRLARRAKNQEKVGTLGLDNLQLLYSSFCGEQAVVEATMDGQRSVTVSPREQCRSLTWLLTKWGSDDV